MKNYIGLFFLMLPLLVSANQQIQWNSESHRAIYLDFNGDAVQDVLLKSKSVHKASQLISGRQKNFSIEFYATNTQTLSPAIGLLLDNASAQFVVGTFNNDKYDDVLVFDNEHRLAYLLAGSRTGFSKAIDVSNSLSKSFKKERKPFSGDFNGDGISDLLILAIHKGKHFLYLT